MGGIRTAGVVTGWLCVVLATLSVSAAEPPSEVDVQRDVVYGTGGGQNLTLHLVRPKQASQNPTPAILFIHGGAWAHGSRDDLLTYATQTAQELGVVTASIGYRLAPDFVFPAQVEDCKCAVRWMRAQAKEFGVDPERIGAIGMSAGAHLSMMLGTMDPEDGLEGEGGWPEQSSKVQAVVAYFGPTDFTQEYPPITKRLIANFIGGSLTDLPDVYRRASPITYVNAGDAPMLLFQGTKDILVPYAEAYRMAEALDRAGVAGRVELMLGMPHGWSGAEGARTKQASLQFFKQRLKLQ